LVEAENKLKRFTGALAAGVDPNLSATWINDAQQEFTEAALTRDPDALRVSRSDA
jgi:hypothetical protein